MSRSSDTSGVSPRQTLPGSKPVGIVYNPASGQGLSRRHAEEAARALEQRGIMIALKESKIEYTHGELEDFLRPLAVLVVAGGDGTLMGLLPSIAAARVPIYMLPGGNESLFARRFMMKRDAGSLLKALENASVETHFFGIVNGRPFFTMLSLGYDSEVVQDIAVRRTGPIGHVGYLLPMLRCALRHITPRMTVTVDGRTVIDGEPGYLIVANSREYALGLDMIPEADSADPELCVRFFPNMGFKSSAWMMLRHLIGLNPNLQNSLFFRGREVKINCLDSAYPMQADGEYVGNAPALIRMADSSILVINGSTHQLNALRANHNHV